MTRRLSYCAKTTLERTSCHFHPGGLTACGIMLLAVWRLMRESLGGGRGEAESFQLLQSSKTLLKGPSVLSGEVLAKKKRVVRRAWTKEDHRNLAKLAKSKIGVRKIAGQLKRTPGATAAMASKRGISLSTAG